MNLIYIVFGLGFVAFGLLFALGRVHTHITAWKLMSEGEKEKVLIGPLCRNIGEVIALSGAIFLINGLVPGIGKHWIAVAMIAWLIVAGLDLFWIEKSGRYEKRRGMENEMLPERSRKGKSFSGRRED